MSVVDGGRRDETAADRGRNCPFEPDTTLAVSAEATTQEPKNGKECYMDYIVLVLSYPEMTLSVGVLGMKIDICMVPLLVMLIANDDRPPSNQLINQPTNPLFRSLSLCRLTYKCVVPTDVDERVLTKYGCSAWSTNLK
jgi:hypothetical protein